MAFAETDRKLAMRYGGENRPRYVRGRHLDRLAKDLGVKPTLVRRRALAMRERAEAALEVARNSLPAEFQDRPMLERIEAVVRERGEMLATRASEAREAVEPASYEEAESVLTRFKFSVRAVDEGLARFGSDIDVFAETLSRADDGVEDELLRELEEVATKIRNGGRDVFDSVVDLDTAVLELIDAAAASDEEAAAGFLDSLAEMGRSSEDLEGLKTFYRTIADLETVSPLLRGPARGMRAGVRDAIDAREILSEWGARAATVRNVD